MSTASNPAFHTLNDSTHLAARSVAAIHGAVSSEPAHSLSVHQLTQFRLALLGRNPSAAEIDDEKQLEQSRGEIRFLQSSGNIIDLLSSWIESAEFKYQWTRNELFAPVQGLDDLENLDLSVRPLVHIHIPKTAGTTLNWAIASHLSPLDSFSQRSLAELLALPLARLLSFRFIAGHYGFTAADLIGFRNPIVFSMARDPLELYPSKWRFFRQQKIVRDSISFEEWLTTAPDLRNYQVRALTTNLRETGPVRLEPHGWIIEEAKTDEDLQRLLAPAIEQLDYLAPSENVDDLYRILHAEAGLPGEPHEILPRLNTTERAEISSEATEIILEMSRVDVEFYRQARLRWATDSQP
jgi:hypothetical protein